jgi:hypothetical protein
MSSHQWKCFKYAPLPQATGPQERLGMSGFVQRFSGPLVQAFPGCFRGGGNSCVDFGADADKELTGVRFVWPLAKRFTGG